MKKRPKTVLLTISGSCPLNCSYCWLPKGEMMKNLHKKLREKIRSGSFIEKLEEVGGEEFNTLALWSYEPAESLDVLQEIIPQLRENFPNLKRVSFNTSLVDPKRILEFAEIVARHKIKLAIRVSLDGPSFVMNENRFKGAAKLVKDNFLSLAGNLENIDDLSVAFVISSTLGIDNIETMAKDKDKIKEFKNFFGDLENRFEEISNSDHIILKIPAPNYAFPGSYSSKDGEVFARFLNTAQSKSLKTFDMRQLRALKRYFGENKLLRKRELTCGAGDVILAVDLSSDNDSYVTVCDRPLFFNNEDFIKETIQSHSKLKGGQVYKKAAIDIVQKSLFFNPQAEIDKARFDYNSACFHDFSKLQLSFIDTAAKELSLSGQISSRYSSGNSELRRFFSLFIWLRTSCRVESVFQNASQHISPFSSLRLWGNGAFRELVDWCFK